jgi:hypothetical protein
MPSSSSPCSSPEVCQRLAQDILALGPTPGRLEYAKDLILQQLASLYAEEHGAPFINRLGEYVEELPRLYVFSPFPSIVQIQAAIDQAYAGAQDRDLHRLLRAFRFYWMEASEALGAAFNVLAARASKGLAPGAATNFCAGCGTVEPQRNKACPECGSGIVELVSHELPALVWRGMQLHVPSELYGAKALEEAGFHLLRAGQGGHRSGISLTFNAFGVTVDVDAIGTGHPPCVLFLAMTTSRVDQGRAMKIKGALESLMKMVGQRTRDKVPLHIVVVTTDEVDDNLDVIGMDRAGITVLGRDQVKGLADALSKIPSRLTVS